MPDSDSVDSVGLSDLEEGERGYYSSDVNDNGFKAYLFNPDDIDELIKAIKVALNIKEPEKNRSIWN